MGKETPTDLSELPVTFGSGKTKLIGKILLPNIEHPMPGVILCHGLGSSYQAVKPSARIMAKYGVAALIFDFHSHGTVALYSMEIWWEMLLMLGTFCPNFPGLIEGVLHL